MGVTDRAIDGFGYSEQLKNSDIGLNPTLRVFDRAVVLHTLCDPSLRDNEKDESILISIKNKRDYYRAPRNSIVCRIITDQKGKSENSDFVCFPFFSSHIMMPVKAGEHVWLLKEQPDSLTERYYWISRIVGPIDVEDANYTHSSRTFQYYYEKDKDQPDDGSGNFSKERILTFPNGSPLLPTSAQISGDQKAYLQIITGSKESNMFTFEPVPRFTKRPGDLVIQGSNNSLISLGTLSGWASERPSVNTSTSTAAGASSISSSSLKKTDYGSIDIVTGRGRIFKDLKSAVGNPKKRDTPDNKTTRPLVVSNELGIETDKNVATQQNGKQEQEPFLGVGNVKTNPQEGNPDFLLDAARVFLASSVKVDEVFNTGNEGVATRFDSPVKNNDGPSIVVKSDHIRIIARKTKTSNSKDLEPSDILETNGSIRIVKEGDKGEDLASITIEPDGTIHISGHKIFLGRSSSDGGDQMIGPGDGGSHPYVRYQELETLWKSTMSALDSFCSQLLKPDPPPAPPPNPSVAVAAGALKASLTVLKDQIANVKSKRIFGE